MNAIKATATKRHTQDTALSFNLSYVNTIMCSSRKLLIILLLASISSLATAQNIKSYIDNDWPDSRYQDHGNGTVTDTKTGLMWKQCQEGKRGDLCAGDDAHAKGYTWKEALEHAQSVNNSGGFAKHSDWRVPNIKELASLAALDRDEPAINSTIFPGEMNHFFWSSSPRSNVINHITKDTFLLHSRINILNGAWCVYFGSNYIRYTDHKTLGSLRLVRGGR